QDDVAARDRALVGADAQGISRELLYIAVLVNLAASGDDALSGAGYVRARMKACLILESDPRSADQRHVRHELGVEAQVFGERRLLLKQASVRPSVVAGRVKVTGH